MTYTNAFIIGLILGWGLPKLWRRLYTAHILNVHKYSVHEASKLKGTDIRDLLEGIDREDE